jgi:SAM-dependent methyltransferase
LETTDQEFFSTETKLLLDLMSAISRGIQSRRSYEWDLLLSKEQLSSKLWIVQTLVRSSIVELGNVLVLGGWVGQLARLIAKHPSLKTGVVRNLDLSELCVEISEIVNRDLRIDDSKFRASHGNWMRLDYEKTKLKLKNKEGQEFVEEVQFDTIINTCCEHESDFSSWLKKIPKNRLLILQSNNLEYPDHVNTTSSLQEFQNHCRLSKTLFSGSMNFESYDRWMLIGYL